MESYYRVPTLSSWSGAEGEGGITIAVDLHARLTYAPLALIRARGVGEEAHDKLRAGRAVKSALYGGGVSHGLCGGYPGEVLQVVGAGVCVSNIS